jgi:hypothetical protein
MKSPIEKPNGADVDRASINRENARHSTGPCTEIGKQRSSLNALRHGLTGQTVVLPSEDLAAYQAFCKRFFDDLKPSGILEEQLVQTLADCSWRLNRARAIETNLLTLGQIEAEDAVHANHPEAAAALAMAHSYRDQAKALANLSMLEQRLSRQFEKALKQLQELQDKRRNTENWQMNRAAELLQMHQERKLPYEPKEDGFVFSTDQIQQHIRREARLEEAGHAWCVRRRAA